MSFIKVSMASLTMALPIRDEHEIRINMRITLLVWYFEEVKRKLFSFSRIIKLAISELQLFC